MSAGSLYFKCPDNLTAKKFLKKLAKIVTLEIVAQEYMCKTFYDSFDSLLYTHNMICEFNHSQKQSNMCLIDRKLGHMIATEMVEDMPRFVGQCAEGRIKKLLVSSLAMRAIIPLCHLPLTVYRLNILNKDQKIVLRLQLDAYDDLNHYVRVLPLKGYDKAAEKMLSVLQAQWHFKPAKSTALDDALKSMNQAPQSYSSKFQLKLTPDTPANEACLHIYLYLLKVINKNESGVIEDIDTEFLHDFRVAVRRTRAGLNQLKNVLPDNELAQYAEFFAWLGQITSTTRDLDVYLLSYQDYKLILPAEMQADLEPFYTLLKQKQIIAQDSLVEHLTSDYYQDSLANWEKYLNSSVRKSTKTDMGGLTVKELADKRIWKMLKRVLSEGAAINHDSPAEALHDLRKTAKKLRYLMEFFASLYTPSDIKLLIKSLKQLQKVLGDFQDYEIQEISLKQFKKELKDNQATENTLLAMEKLVTHLEHQRGLAREKFADRFNLFQKIEHQAQFQLLFAPAQKVKS